MGFPNELCSVQREAQGFDPKFVRWVLVPDNLYSCLCGLTCLWTKSPVLADNPDALLFETSKPPLQRHSGDPLRVYMDLEAGRKRSGLEEIFTMPKMMHSLPMLALSFIMVKIIIYRLLRTKNQLAKKLLSLLPHHSYRKCLNNVGSIDMALSFYPGCAIDVSVTPKWWDHLHCAMSHYKLVLAIENTMTESNVTEKLFYALDSGAVPIYFGASNVLDLVPHSIIDGTKYSSLEGLASYVKALANDPVAYAEYHAWRRCGVLGNYKKTHVISLDTLPCRLCHAVSKKGSRNAVA